MRAGPVCCLRIFSLCALVCANTCLCRAQKYPSDAGVINVTSAPYFADSTGSKDATDAINRALNDYPNGMAIIYLPAGKYALSGTLRWPGYEQGSFGNVILEGEDANRTLLILRDSCAGFANAGEPREVIYTGTDPAQQFRNAIRDLTIYTGKGNPGAIGARFMANNQGGIFNVKIISGDRTGILGLDLAYVNENGPLLVKNLEIVGFNTGIQCGSSQNSQTFEGLILRDQLKTGLYNESQVVSINGLRSFNRVTSIHNAGTTGTIVLLNASFTGSDTSMPAIINHAVFYARELSSTDGMFVVSNNCGQGKSFRAEHLREWSSHWTEMDSSRITSLYKMKIMAAPELLPENLNTWLAVPPSNGIDDTPAFQDVIDRAASTVYLPRGTYLLKGKVHIRGKVSRIVGLEACINTAEEGGFLLDGGTSPVVVMERITSGYEPGFFIEHSASRTLVLKNACNVSVRKNAGSGDLFLEDVCSNPASHFEFHGGNVWARQLNVENAGTHILNNGSNVWILGLKTERNGILVDTRNGGHTEVLGFFCYTTILPASTMFANSNATFFAVGSETSWYSNGYRIILKEKINGRSRKFPAGGFPSGNGSGHAFPFIVSEKE